MPTCSRQFQITVGDDDDTCLTNDSALPGATTGDPYSATLIPAFAPDPGMQFVFTVVSGTLLDGLLLDSATGEIAGTPTGGVAAFCVELTQIPL